MILNEFKNRYTSPSITIGSNTLINNGINTSDVFLANLTTANSIAWVKSGGGINDDKVTCMSGYTGGKIFLAGGFNSPVFTIGSNSVANVNPGTSDVFIAGFDCNGNPLTLKQAGGMGNEQSTFITGGYQYIYTGGWFDSPSFLYNATTLTNAGGKDIFVGEIVDMLENGLANNYSSNIAKLYPNPVNDKLNIEFNSTGVDLIKINIYNILGQIVYANESLKIQQQIDLSFLPKGIYYLRMDGRDFQKDFKIAKD